MHRDAIENSLPNDLSPLALFLTRSVKDNFGFAAWGDAIFYHVMWTTFKRSKTTRNRIAKSRLPYMYVTAPPSRHERYKMHISRIFTILFFVRS